MSTSVLCCVVLIACEQALMQPLGRGWRQRGLNSEGEGGGERKMKLLFTASCSPPLARSRVLARLASLVQMESFLAGSGVKPMLNTELN